MQRLLRLEIAVLLGSLPLLAHVGSPDIFYEGTAGPYRLLVTIRPPQVIPGVAEVEVRSVSPEVRQVRIVPLPMTGPGARLAPVPDVAQPSHEDPQFYTGSLWLMATGSWQVRVSVDGGRGPGTVSVPVPAVSTRMLAMQGTLVAVLIPLGLVLLLGIVSIIGAGAREAQLEPGEEPDRPRMRRARVAMAVTGLVAVGAVWMGNQWWTSEAGVSQRNLFKPLALRATVENGGTLRLRLEDPGWLNRQTDDLLPDHNHLMHLYVIRLPAMDRVWHLHPELTAPATFTQALPDMPAGRYALYGDIVHASGFPDTATTELDLPAIAGHALTGDDSAGEGPRLDEADYNRNVALLPDGDRMVWERGPGPLRARQAYEFRFRLEESSGRPAGGMELYMGMQGHAAIVSPDGSVFAHIHPAGSVPMAALSLTTPGLTMPGMATANPGGGLNPHAAHGMVSGEVPSEISFPYGFPKPGPYRLFVQVKRAGQVETGVFDTRVEN